MEGNIAEGGCTIPAHTAQVRYTADDLQRQSVARGDYHRSVTMSGACFLQISAEPVVR